MRKLRKELDVESSQSDLRGWGETKSCQTGGLAILEHCEERWCSWASLLFFFLLQEAVVLFALKTLFMKSTQLGSISNESPAFCGPSICQWLAMHRGTEWVSSRRWASLATEVKQSTSSSVSSTSQVSSASWVNFESYSSFPFLRISRLPLELKGAPLFWLSLYKSDLRAGQTNQECGSP